MPDRPSYHCGATDCCTGGYYPECQENFSLGQHASHYEDDTTGKDACPYTD